MQKISTCLWFDHQAEEAAKFYTSIFKNSKIGTILRYGEAGPGPKGSVLTVAFQLDGQEFTALNRGPVFKFSPATSFFVNCESREESDEIWAKLSGEGTVLMPLGEYPFSRKFGWLQDKFGLSWQLNLGSRPKKITPSLMFVGKQHGRAGEAVEFYSSVFPNSHMINLERYPAGGPEPEGTVKHAIFSLQGQEFMAMDSNGPHPFTFTPAFSFVVKCETQEQVDNYWEKLSAGGEKNRCGWLTDKFGVSWQIVLILLLELLQDKDPKKAKKVTEAMLKMDKLEIQPLIEASQGK